MSIPDSLRIELADRRLALIRRIERLEVEIEQAATRDAVTRQRLCEFLPVIDEIASSDRHELGLVENALRRIASREYDCCMTCGRQIPSKQLEVYWYMVNCDECARGFGAEYQHHLRTQHVDLRRLIDSLGSALSAVKHADSATLAIVGCRVILEDLAGLLPDHFALEERGGYLAEVLTVAPRLSRPAEALSAEHGEFRRRLSALHEHARAAGRVPDRWRPVEAEFLRLASDLLRHEREETELVQSAFEDDLGSSG